MNYGMDVSCENQCVSRLGLPFLFFYCLNCCSVCQKYRLLNMSLTAIEHYSHTIGTHKDQCGIFKIIPSILGKYWQMMSENTPDYNFQRFL